MHFQSKDLRIHILLQFREILNTDSLLFLLGITGAYHSIFITLVSLHPQAVFWVTFFVLPSNS